VNVDRGAYSWKEAGVVRKPIVISPEQGRVYAMGQMRAIFNTDSSESAGGYSVSEWWFEPRTRGPGMHAHPDRVFCVIAGTLSVRVNDECSRVLKGGCVVIPGGTPHTFENQGSAPSGFISFNSSGGFQARVGTHLYRRRRVHRLKFDWESSRRAQLD
jgi:mannose-6-phosphate isomerase-like protein (cupin superfamily)